MSKFTKSAHLIVRTVYALIALKLAYFVSFLNRVYHNAACKLGRHKFYVAPETYVGRFEDAMSMIRTNFVLTNTEAFLTPQDPKFAKCKHCHFKGDATKLIEKIDAKIVESVRTYFQEIKLRRLADDELLTLMVDTSFETWQDMAGIQNLGHYNAIKANLRSKDYQNAHKNRNTAPKVNRI